MALSNTATPIYYGRFKEKVNSGRLPINKHIEAEMNRIDELIADPFYYYDDNAIEGFIAFCEGELTLTDGQPVKMLDTFKLWAEQIFSWFYFETQSQWDPEKKRMVEVDVKKRLTLKQYLIVARGGAKSMYASFIQAYFLVCHPETTSQITTAPTMRQAEEVTVPIGTAITRAPGPVFQFLTEGSIHNTTGNRLQRQQLASTKLGIQNFVTGSILEIRPMSINKVQGARPKIVTVDEWLSGDIREDVIGALEQGASKHDDYLIVAISSEGTVRNGPGDTMKIELGQILRGEQYAPHISIWHYMLDDVKEVGMPEMWVKAQPNIDLTVGYDVYQRDVDRMEANPSTKNDILAKRFGIPREGFSFFFTYEETIPQDRRLDFRGMECSLGADLSQGDDFCAFTFLFPLRGGEFGIKTLSYISELTLHKLGAGPRELYDELIKEGSLHVMDGTVLDLEVVYEAVAKHIDKMDYVVEAFGYDPWHAEEFVKAYIQDNGPHGVMKVHQGARTESVPLGEIKKLISQKMLHFNQRLLQFALGNCVVLEDTNGNRKLWKQRREEKIDNVSALVNAYVAHQSNKDSFD